ncbi:MAG: hypothetical protein QOD06_1413 [Candidatus Binatota bacterium]|jgi:DNA-binding transcriptional MocR family regulator|nr:hypothetical protein [Candidatus Binatota bacterium]
MNIAAQYGIAGREARTIAASVEAAIREHRLAPGAAVPTVRSLARALGVSPATVSAAYRTLRTRGLVHGRSRRGTQVRHQPPVSARPAVPVAAGLRNLAYGAPDPALLPRLRRAAAHLDSRPRLYGEPASLAALRRVAAADLARDGVSAEHVTVVSGALDGIERVLQAHLRPGDRVAVEDPGYAAVLDLTGALGLVPESVEVDDSGPRPGDLARALACGCEAFILTPRAQNPTGAAVDDERAGELRRVLDRHPRVLLIEDDHAGPVAGAPAVTLSADRGRWAVVRSVSKWLGPDLRLAILAGDPTTVSRVEGRLSVGSGWVSHVLQEIAAFFWTDPATRRLLARATATYAERRRVLLAALAARGIEARGRSGLNVWIPVREESPVVTALADDGWAIRAGERFRLRSGPAVRITTATLGPRDAERVADALHRALAGDGRTSVP